MFLFILGDFLFYRSLTVSNLSWSALIWLKDNLQSTELKIMSLKWLSYLLKRQYSQNTASLFQKIPLWSQKVERCLCLVQNQALIEHYDHEVQSKLYRQINTSYACTRLSIIWLARKITHILTVVDVWRHQNHRQMSCRKILPIVKLFIHPL